ncbi:hypothetical protein BXZ70DRAFT_1000391 [Cristinia sonorae]|uniref:Neuroguidin n=1 Tax=Cristinia sonorae TaxID=1940300 RepID=A0A8K0UNV6_9AGAR|nr:hypothetical protein BXZ70DRAFT_1000391 [Cristinia sonorae]
MAETHSEINMDELEQSLDEIRKGMSAAREVVKSLNERVQNGDLDTKDGISLLSVKNNVMVQYLQSLVLLSAHRAAGHGLSERTPPAEPWGTPNRSPRGAAAGDRVDAMIEGRVVMEKIRLMEGKMKYQIDKLTKLAQEEPEAAQDVANDPLAFRPNPEDLMNQETSDEDDDGDDDDDKRTSKSKDGIYRPPKLAPMPYIETSGKDKSKSRRGPLPSALSNLAQMDLSMPHMESTSGLGSTPALTSRRAKELQRMTEFEEENMTRLVMKKKEAKRRREDEADIALGGIGGGDRGRGRGGGFEDEFGDIIRSVGRTRVGVVGDGYEELRQKGKKESVLARARSRGDDDGLDGGEDVPRQRKKSRFDNAVKSVKRRTNSKLRR